MHEPILLDASSWWRRPCCGSEIGIAEKPFDIIDDRRIADEPVSQSRPLRLARRQGRGRGAQSFRRIWRQHRRRSDEPRHRARPVRVATDQPANRAQHRHGRRLLSRAVASPLCEGYHGRGDRGGDLAGLRRLRRRARGLRWNGGDCAYGRRRPSRSLARPLDSIARHDHDALGLLDRTKEWPSVLSGGRKQRAAVASALDAPTRIEMQRLVEQVWLSQGPT